MTLKIILACWTLLGSSAALAGEPAGVVGTWEREPIAGVAGFSHLTFTPDGRLLADQGRLLGDRIRGQGQVLGRYQVDKRRVSARSSFGETYAFELIDDGRLCVFPGPGMTPLAGDRAAKLASGQCFRKSASPT
jgi:hypothetical protein